MTCGTVLHVTPLIYQLTYNVGHNYWPKYKRKICMIGRWLKGRFGSSALSYHLHNKHAVYSTPPSPLLCLFTYTTLRERGDMANCIVIRGPIPTPAKLQITPCIFTKASEKIRVLGERTLAHGTFFQMTSFVVV